MQCSMTQFALTIHYDTFMQMSFCLRGPFYGLSSNPIDFAYRYPSLCNIYGIGTVYQHGQIHVQCTYIHNILETFSLQWNSSRKDDIDFQSYNFLCTISEPLKARDQLKFADKRWQKMEKSQTFSFELLNKAWRTLKNRGWATGLLEVPLIAVKIWVNYAMVIWNLGWILNGIVLLLHLPMLFSRLMGWTGEMSVLEWKEKYHHGVFLLLNQSIQI